MNRIIIIALLATTVATEAQQPRLSWPGDTRHVEPARPGPSGRIPPLNRGWGGTGWYGPPPGYYEPLPEGGAQRLPWQEWAEEGPEADTPRTKRWLERCKPVFKRDSLGIDRPTYAAPGCEFGD